VSGNLVSTNNPYLLTVTSNETLLADFAWLAYDISTSSSPTNGAPRVAEGKSSAEPPYL
jgi:hypothetical protein